MSILSARTRWSITIGVLLIGVLCNESIALVSFGAPRPLSSYAGADDPSATSVIEGSPSVAGDGNGNWVVVWFAAPGPPIGDAVFTEMYVSSSTNNGATWSPAVTLATTAGSDIQTWIATDQAGVWIAVWVNVSSDGVLASRSTDNGQTWSAPALILPDTIRPRIVYGKQGTWMVAGDSDGAVITTRSLDGGLSWSLPLTIDSDDPSNTAFDIAPKLAADESGNWVVFWRRSSLAMVARSADDGVSWSAPTQIGLAGPYVDRGGHVTTDNSGHWLAVWDFAVPDPQRFHFAVSSDNGASWTSEAIFPPLLSNGGRGFANEVWLQADDAGVLYAAWEISESYITGPDTDLFMSRSLDGGYTWTHPSAVNLRGRVDGREVNDGPAYLGYDGEDSWVSVWASANSFDGTIGDDFDIVYALASDDCPTAPLTGCMSTTNTGGSRLMLKEDPDGAGDRLTWIWSAGEETTPADLGDPTTTSGYALCMYDRIGLVQRSVFEADASAAADCGGTPCWAATATGFSYRDAGATNGAITGLSLAAGPDGRAKIKVKASKDALGLPRMPLSINPSLQIQLLNTETGACWEASYSSTTLNDGLRLKARSD